jgi:hypothetical protein
VVARKILVRGHVNANGRGIRHGSVAHPARQLRPCGRAFLRW